MLALNQTSVKPSDDRYVCKWVGALIVAVLLVYLISPAASSETITWDNPAGGLWNVDANWLPMDVPNEAGEEALFPVGGGLFTATLNVSTGLDLVTIDNTDATLAINSSRTLTLYEPGGLNNSGLVTLNGTSVTISGDIVNNTVGRILVPAAMVLNLHGPTATNNGTITINSDLGAGIAKLVIYNNAVELDGSGEIVLQTPGGNSYARLEHYSSGYLTQSEDHTIRGNGQILTKMTNNGLIEANVMEEDLYLSTGAKLNNGIMRASGGGYLTINTGTITQGENGLIMADGGTVILTGSAKVSGGTISTDNGGVIQCTGSGTRIDSLTNLGDYEIIESCLTDVYEGVITNEGTITVNSTQGAGNALLRIYNGIVTFDGSGEIVLKTAGSHDDAHISRYTGSLVQEANHTIRGEGKISVGMTNNGLIQADVSGRDLYLNSIAKENNGIMKATNAGRLSIDTGAITQGPGGQIIADGGEVFLSGSASITGGTLLSDNGGVFLCTAAGTSLDDLSIDADYEIPSASRTDLKDGTITNDGTITINSTQGDAAAYLRIHDGIVTVDGDGEIVMQTNGNNDDAQIMRYIGSMVQGAGHTIRGDGRILVGLTNNGLIQADTPGRDLLLRTLAKTNNGVMKATNGGFLSIDSGPITQGPDGLIIADGGEVWLSGSAQVEGGTLSTENGGVIKCISSGARIKNLTNLGDYDIEPNCYTSVLAGTIVNNGTFTINSTSSDQNSGLQIYDGLVTFDGTGEIVMQTAGDPADAQIYRYVGSMAQGPDHTIRGEGSISVALTNDGLVEADVPDRVLELRLYTKINNGLMRSVGSSLLNTASSFTNNGIVAAADSGLFRSASLANHYSGSTLTGGTWQVYANSTMRLIGVDVQTLAAKIQLDGLESNLYSDDATTDALANLDTINRGGYLEIDSGRNFNSISDLTVDYGAIEVGEGSAFTVNGLYTQIGNGESPNPDGWTCVNGTFGATTDPIDIQGGRLMGTGTVNNSVISAGRTCPGASAGELTIAGDFTQTEDGTCWIELAGLDAASYDHLQINGDAFLAGRLVVTSIEGYEPEPGDRFTILNCSNRTGEFTLETGAPGLGLQYDTYYYADRVEIEVYEDLTYVPDLEPEEPDANLVPTSMSFFSRNLSRGSTHLTLDLPEIAEVTLEIFDFSGRRVVTLVEGTESAGRHHFTWNGETSSGARAASGIYFARASISVGNSRTTRLARLAIVR